MRPSPPSRPGWPGPWVSALHADAVPASFAYFAMHAGKRRREAFDFLGGAVIKKQLAEGVPRKRVGLLIASGAPARQHSKLLGPDGAVVGEVTSGGFSPCLQKNIAMGAPPPGGCLSRPGRQCVVLTYAAPSACQATSTMPCPRRARRSRSMCAARSTTLW